MADSEQQLKRGTLELILLHLVEERPRYGYELVSEMAERSGGFFRLKEGTLYPVLYRLEDRGCIRAEWSRPERGVPRKYYRLTETGARRLGELRAAWGEFSRAVERVLGDDPGGEDA